MRRKLIAGNWKMFHGPSQTEKFLTEFTSLVQPSPHMEWVLFPPYVSLHIMREKLKGHFIKYGSQNCFSKSEGAYTGEISPPMLSEMGCKYVLVGHSERRQYFDETNASCAQKIKIISEFGMTPLYCVGETQIQREENKTESILTGQILEGLSQYQTSHPLVIAYEPVWAIGTGKVATPQIAEEAHKIIRKTLAQKFTHEISSKIPLLYGGSVKPENAPELAIQPNIDGFLVGGASLTAKSFAQIGQIPL